MKLLDLDPRGIGCNGYSGRVGITFECPCCRGTDRATRLAVYFFKDVVGDHGEAIHVNNIGWSVTNPTDMQSITIQPSIDASNEGHWHGFITNGGVT